MLYLFWLITESTYPEQILKPYRRVSLDFLQIMLTTTTFSFAFSSLVSFVFLFSLASFAFCLCICFLRPTFMRWDLRTVLQFPAVMVGGRRGFDDLSLILFIYFRGIWNFVFLKYLVVASSGKYSGTNFFAMVTWFVVMPFPLDCFYTCLEEKRFGGVKAIRSIFRV